MADTIETYRENYAALLFSSLCFGAYAVLTGQSISLLWTRWRRTRRAGVALVYSVFMAAVTTMWYCAGARLSAYGFVDAFFDPGAGEGLFCQPAYQILRVSSALQILLSDALLMYRLHALWDGAWSLLLLPTGILAAAACVGFTMNLQCLFAAHGGPLPVNTRALLALHESFFGLTITFNVLASVLIANRLLRLGHALRALDADGLRAPGVYTSPAGVLVESAAVYAVTGLVYVPFYVHEAPGSSILSSIFQAFAFLSPALIIHRVARGVAYAAPASTRSAQATTAASAAQFARGGESSLGPWRGTFAHATAGSAHDDDAQELEDAVGPASAVTAWAERAPPPWSADADEDLEKWVPGASDGYGAPADGEAVNPRDREARLRDGPARSGTDDTVI